jgi:hypothetical protein
MNKTLNKVPTLKIEGNEKRFTEAEYLDLLEREIKQEIKLINAELKGFKNGKLQGDLERVLKHVNKD